MWMLVLFQLIDYDQLKRKKKLIIILRALLFIIYVNWSKKKSMYNEIM